MESQIVSFSRELADLAARISPSVVAVEGRRRMYSCGVHWRKNLIVTAEHTVRRDDDIAITLSSGKKSQVKLVGRDPGSDIALLQADNIDIPVISSDVPREILPGQITLIVGRSPNSGPNVSMGIISAVSGPWHTWRGGNLDSYIRLDVTVFSGSSGGAVVNAEGAIIGIATSALSRVAGLAIPRTTVNKVVDLLLKHGSVPRGYVGLGLQRVPLPESLRKSLSIESSRGLMVYTLEAGGPAEQGGVMIGDILLSVEGKSLSSVEDLQAQLTAETIGKSLKIKVIRGGAIEEIGVKIGERGRGEES